MRYVMGIVLFLSCAAFFASVDHSALRAVAMVFAGGAAAFLLFVPDEIQ